METGCADGSGGGTEPGPDLEGDGREEAEVGEMTASLCAEGAHPAESGVLVTEKQEGTFARGHG